MLPGLLALLQRSSTTGDDARERRAEARRALNELALALHSWRLFLPGDVWLQLEHARRDMGQLSAARASRARASAPWSARASRVLPGCEVLRKAVDDSGADDAAGLHARVVSRRRVIEEQLGQLVDMPVDVAAIEATPPGGALLPDRTIADVTPPPASKGKKRARPL